MIDIEPIRQRLALAESVVSGSPDAPGSAFLRQLCGDLSALLSEIDALRAICPHTHVLPVDNADGRAALFACVNCHKLFSHSGAHLEPQPGDFEDVE